MADNIELWDVYTKDRVRTGQLHVRGQQIQKDQYHLVVHVCIFNSKNEMLIQQRQPFKSGWPNVWDITMGGSAVAGDNSSQAAEREVFEELGIKIDLSEIVLQETEVKAVKWASKEEILRMQEEGTFIPYWFLDKLFDMKKWFQVYRNLEQEYPVQYATKKNLNSWMSMVEIIRDNFPGLETQEKLDDYRKTVEKNIDRRTAICALFGNMVIGILLFSEKHNMLSCMAVHPEFRRKHIAERMVNKMLKRLDHNRPVVVETFREEDEKGEAPRAFYKKMGFEEGELCWKEEGYPIQKFYYRTEC